MNPEVMSAGMVNAKKSLVPICTETSKTCRSVHPQDKLFAVHPLTEVCQMIQPTRQALGSVAMVAQFALEQSEDAFSQTQL